MNENAPSREARALAFGAVGRRGQEHHVNTLSGVLGSALKREVICARGLGVNGLARPARISSRAARSAAGRAFPMAILEHICIAVAQVSSSAFFRLQGRLLLGGLGRFLRSSGRPISTARSDAVMRNS